MYTTKTSTKIIYMIYMPISGAENRLVFDLLPHCVSFLEHYIFLH